MSVPKFSNLTLLIIPIPLLNNLQSVQSLTFHGKHFIYLLQKHFTLPHITQHIQFQYIYRIAEYQKDFTTFHDFIISRSIRITINSNTPYISQKHMHLFITQNTSSFHNNSQFHIAYHISQKYNCCILNTFHTILVP